MSAPRHSVKALPLATVLAQSAQDAARQHGVYLLDIRPLSATSDHHLPGSARLPVADATPHEGELPSYLLSEPGRRIVVVADEVAIAAATATELAQRGWAADYCAERVPGSAWRPGATTAALWQPSPQLVRCLALLAEPGEAVDFGCGSGRDLVYLAQHGWQVLGIDRLPDALAMARQRATLHQVSIGTECADVRQVEPMGRSFDLALCVRYTELSLLSRAHAWVRAGGLFLFHGYGVDTELKPPRSMRARNRLSLAMAQELLASQHWQWVWEPRIEWNYGECWQVFLARRMAS